MTSKSSYHGRAHDPAISKSTVSLPRRASFTYPDRFKDSQDADIDVAAPKTKRGQYLNQSFLSVLAMTNVADPSLPSDAQTSQLLDESPYSNSPHTSPKHARRTVHTSTPNLRADRRPVPRPPRARTMHKESTLEAVTETMSNSQLLTPHQEMTESILLPPLATEQSRHDQSTDAASHDGTSDGLSPSESTEGGSILQTSQQSRSNEINTNLSSKLAEIFGLDRSEKFESDFPCWLLQSVLLQGHMYVTSRHVCFYAYLPRKQGATSKSGYITKRGRQNPNFRRYWFVLKGHALSYYTNASDLYFPRSMIDLRGALAAELESGDRAADGKGFYVSMPTKIHHFRAESVVSAQEWVKQISQAIFRAKNESDSVKVSLPIENMLDIDSNPVLDFAETVKIRIIDNDETFAIDEYFFSFFGHGQDALEVLQSKVSSNTINQGASRLQQHDVGPFPSAYTEFEGSRVATSSASQIESLDNEDGAILQAGIQGEDTPGGRESDTKTSNSLEASQSFDSSSVAASQILQRSDIYYHPSKQRQHTGAVLFEQDEKSAHARDNQSSAKSMSSSVVNDGSAQDGAASSNSKLQDLMRAGSAPLQKASGIAGLLRAQSQRVSNVLANESKVVYEKVTNMWAGKTMHFDDVEGMETSKTVDESEDESGENVGPSERFRSYFALPATEKLRASYHGYLNRVIPVFGKIYVSDYNICFRNLLPTVQTRMILPLNDVETVEKEKGFRFGYSGLVIVVRGHEELFLEFGNADARDDLCGVLLQSLGDHRQPERTEALERHVKLAAAVAKAEFESLEEARKNSPMNVEETFHSIPIDDQPEHPPVIFDDCLASMIDFKPAKPQRVTCLTIGSRGDVQPYIALCKGLLEEGHQATIATHAEFEPWIRSHGIDFIPVAGDPAEIMRLCVEHDMFTVSFFREATVKFRGWIDQLLKTSWQACQNTDILIESPSAMAGIHIAEALQIPYFRAFTMPWTRTRAYPHAFAVPSQKMGGNYNVMSYVMFDNVFWQAIAGQINRWRAKSLGLPWTSLDRLQTNNVPFLYNFSPSVVAPPLDFSPWIHVTGYWFLDEGEDYEPPPELSAFIAKARNDRKKIVYVGFGSIVVDDPTALTITIVDSVLRADVRCILSKGWSDRLEKKMDTTPEVPLPPEIIQIKSAPHDWLFSKIDAAVHHGGAGTTGASLRAGIPTVVKPFFGDQFFFGSRIEDLGVGRCLMKINKSVFARALWEVTNSERMIVKARALGERIREESGVSLAIQMIYRDLEYATSQIKRGKKRHDAKASVDDQAEADSWTIVGNDSDFETDGEAGEL